MNYFLRTKETTGESNLFFRIRKQVGSKKVDWWFYSLVIVDIKEWNKAQSSSTNLAKYQKTEEGKKVFSFLNTIDDAVENLFAEGCIKSEADKSRIEKVVSDIVYQEEKERQQKEGVTILKFLDDFVKGIEDGSVLHKGKRYSEGSVTIWKSFAKHLRDYMNNNIHTPFSAIDKRWADGLSAFFSSKLGMMPTTVNKNITCMRKLVNLASEYDIYKGSLKLFPERKVEDFEKKAKLTADERKQLKAFKEYAEEHHSRKGELFYRDGKDNVKRPKYELATSHSARRSGITNLYTEGNLDTREMMSISGHQSEKVFAEYIKLSKLEQAMKVGSKRLGSSESTKKTKRKKA